MRYIRIIGKVIKLLYFTLITIILMSVITIILIKDSIDEIINGQELWLCMLSAALLTWMVDFEEQMKQ